MSIFEKLTALQQDLNVPKNQFNSFGKYSYRSCEEIKGCRLVETKSLQLK